MSAYLVPIISSIIAILFTGFVTYYFATRNHHKRMRDIAKEEIRDEESNFVNKTYDIVRKECKESVELHNKEKHKMDTAVTNSMHHMELKQNSMNLKLNFLTTLMSEMAKKMQIIITPDMFPKEENGE